MWPPNPWNLGICILHDKRDFTDMIKFKNLEILDYLDGPNPMTNPQIQTRKEEEKQKRFAV